MFVIEIGSFRFDVECRTAILKWGRWEGGVSVTREARAWSWGRDHLGRRMLSMGPLHADWGWMPMRPLWVPNEGEGADAQPQVPTVANLSP